MKNPAHILILLTALTGTISVSGGTLEKARRDPTISEKFRGTLLKKKKNPKKKYPTIKDTDNGTTGLGKTK